MPDQDNRVASTPAARDGGVPDVDDLREQVAERLSSLGITHVPQVSHDPLYDRLAERVVDDVIEPLVRRLEERIAEQREINEGWARYGDRVKVDRATYADMLIDTLGITEPRGRWFEYLVPMACEEIRHLRSVIVGHGAAVAGAASANPRAVEVLARWLFRMGGRRTDEPLYGEGAADPRRQEQRWDTWLEEGDRERLREIARVVLADLDSASAAVSPTVPEDVRLLDVGTWCEACDQNVTGSHYHCARCGRRSGQMGHRLYSCPAGPDPAPPQVAAPVAEPAGHGSRQGLLDLRDRLRRRCTRAEGTSRYDRLLPVLRAVDPDGTWPSTLDRAGLDMLSVRTVELFDRFRQAVAGQEGDLGAGAGVETASGRAADLWDWAGTVMFLAGAPAADADGRMVRYALAAALLRPDDLGAPPTAGAVGAERFARAMGAARWAAMSHSDTGVLGPADLVRVLLTDLPPGWTVADDVPSFAEFSFVLKRTAHGLVDIVQIDYPDDRTAVITLTRRTAHGRHIGTVDLEFPELCLLMAYDYRPRGDG